MDDLRRRMSDEQNRAGENQEFATADVPAQARMNEGRKRTQCLKKQSPVWALQSTRNHSTTPPSNLLRFPWMSALERIADSSRTSRYVRFVPQTDSSTAANSGSFDRLCGAFNAAIDLTAQRPKVDRLGQKRLGMPTLLVREGPFTTLGCPSYVRFPPDVSKVPISDSCTPATNISNRPSHKRARAICGGFNWSALLWRINGLGPPRMRSNNDAACHLRVINEKRHVVFKAQVLKV